MARGGARNRYGPGVDPLSGRSDARGVKFSALPSEGFDGEVPAFSLPAASGRELEVWADLWETPQAAAWSLQPWRWDQIADLVRMQVRSEAVDAPVGIYAQVRAARADLGLTPAGLKENGWAIAADEVAEKRAEQSGGGDAPQRRLRAVSD
jgi:hypothetical protein